MLHAMLRRKLTRDEEGMEDLLTSNTFGLMVYMPPEQALGPFLRTSVNPLTGQRLGAWLNGIVRVEEWRFWPRLSHPNCLPCEPDVELDLSDATGPVRLLVEAKYRSGKSSFATADGLPRDQLAREFDNLKYAAGTVRCAVVYVTADAYCPKDEIHESAAEYRLKRGGELDIFWTSWRFLPSLLEPVTVTRPGLLRDMCELLVALDLTTFTQLRYGFTAPSWAFERPSVAPVSWSVPPLVWRFGSQEAIGQTAAAGWNWGLTQPNALYKWGAP